MTDIDEITERLHRERDALPVTATDDGLRVVRRLVRRRKRQQTLIGVAAAGGLLVAGVGVVGAIDSRDRDTVVTDTSPAATMADDSERGPETSAAPTTDVVVDTTAGTTTTTSSVAADPTPSAPSVAAPVVGRAVDADLLDVTADLAAGVGDFFLDWQVPWNDGFLIGGQISGSDESAAFFSPDGRTWEPVRFDADIGQPARDGIAVANDRLAMVGTRGDPSQPTLFVAGTTDLSNWTVDDIPVEMSPADLPTIVEAITWPPKISANDHGWIVTVDRSLMLDSVELVKQRTGRTVSSLSESWSDEGILITIDPDAEGTESEEVWIPWSEIEAEIGVELTDAVHNGTPVEVWSGSWDGDAPMRVEDPDAVEHLNSYEPLIAVDKGFVALRTTREFPDDAPPVESSVLFASLDGRVWSELDVPFPDHVAYGFPLDGDLGVVVRADDGTISIHRVDVETETWTPIEVPGLPQTMSYVQTSATAALEVDAAPPYIVENGPSTTTFEQNGLRLVWTYDSYISSYEVTSIDTGEAVVAESIDIREVEGSFDLAFEHLTGGLSLDTTITDPATGEVLMNITVEEMEAANPREPDFGPDPEPWIVATDDGTSWFVYEVPSADPDQDRFYEESMVVSGGRLLYRSASDEWFVVDLA